MQLTRLRRWSRHLRGHDAVTCSDPLGSGIPANKQAPHKAPRFVSIRERYSARLTGRADPPPTPVDDVVAEQVHRTLDPIAAPDIARDILGNQLDAGSVGEIGGKAHAEEQ